MSLLENLASYRYVAPACSNVPVPVFGLEWLFQPDLWEIPHPRMHPGYYQPGVWDIPHLLFGLEWMFAPDCWMDLPWPACADEPSPLVIFKRKWVYAYTIGAERWWYWFQ